MFKKLLGLIMYYSAAPYKFFVVFKIHIKEISPVYSLMSVAAHPTLACSERVAKDKFVQSTTCETSMYHELLSSHQ